jgi:hypothetical protein
MTRPTPLRRAALITIVATTLAVAGCGPTAPVSSSPASTGHVIVQLEIAPQAEQFFASQHRGRIVAADGSVLADWEITAAAAPIAVPAGPVQLQGFTVFLSDFLQCSPDPAAPGKEHCAAPTLGPTHTCAIPIEIAPGATVEARFRSLPQGRCELVGIPPASEFAPPVPGST